MLYQTSYPVLSYQLNYPAITFTYWHITERVSTQVVVVVVVVVAQPVYLHLCVCLKCNVAEVSQIATWTPAPSHRRVTWEGSFSDKLYKFVFCGITGQVVAMLVKLTTKTHSVAAGYFSQLHRYSPPFWFWMKLIGLHHKAKTAIKSTKASQITISYKHTLLIYKQKYKFNV